MKPSEVERWLLAFVCCLAFGVAMLLGRACFAQDERPELPELTLLVCPDLAGIDADGEVVHFPRTTADCMLARLRLLPPVIRYVSLLEQRLRLDDQRIELRDREVALAVEQAEVATENLETALRRAREAEEEKDAWYRHPAFWFAVGVVITIALEVAAVFAFNEVTP